eukprot:CAMPEP_0203821716 /NCGR_PEP_ID=MMETSP0115-20131106/43987_1 /ASSEMBLY_ACC=CAM_ASM_000227 /TAXON_ID=33651 /ORGANISM="Bicosoecid sp, Strain ms1" /LENGTH=150 /DNA_ID=CAMNT_0050730743 /DNA_START=92 /DNA_END=541 /DNA_ORIENTATION=+
MATLFADDDLERARRKKMAQQAKDLEEQIRLKAERLAAEKAAEQAAAARERAESEAYNPWGRGGAGAPLRDAATGAVVTDLHLVISGDVKVDHTSPTGKGPPGGLGGGGGGGCDGGDAGGRGDRDVASRSRVVGDSVPGRGLPERVRVWQ